MGEGLVVLLLSVSGVLAGVLGQQGASEIRGLPPSKVSLYALQGGSFRCLDGSATIPSKYVNDDYCDCFDGTDEPGTSACPNGSFYCANVGYRPGAIPSSRVNDGICDCCDGTDEYSVSGRCANSCLEMGRALREEEERQRLLYVQGHETFRAYAQQGTAAIADRRSRLAELEVERERVDAERAQVEEVKKTHEGPETEAKERHKANWEAEKAKRKEEKKAVDAQSAFADLDLNQDGLLTAAELQTHLEFDIDTNGEVSADEAKEYLEEREEVDAETFRTLVWDNIHQIYHPPQAAAPPAAEGGGQEGEDRTQTVMPPEDLDEERDHDEEDEDEDEDDENDHKVEGGVGEKKGDDEEPMPEYDAETQRLINAAEDARRRYNTVDEQFRNIESEISEIKKLLDMDLGEQNVYYALKGKCFDYSDREYTYTLCPFDRTTQRSKSGGGETSLGRWGQWSGAEGDKYAMMTYEHGQNCWNGPDRSAKVHIKCGVESELISASEPNRCEYHFVFNTPAACSRSAPPPTSSSGTDAPPDRHVEL